MFVGRRIVACLLFAIAATASGCRERDEIRTYPVPPLAKTPQEILDSIVEYRIWGIIIPSTDGSSFFFKTQGPVKNLSAFEADFDSLAKSIRFPNGVTQNPVWDLPAGWSEDRSNKNRIATLTFGRDPKLQLSVTRFQGTLVDNVNRWRKMVGAEEVAADQISRVTTKYLTSTNHDAYRVDARGKKDPDAGMRGMGMPGQR